MKDLTINYFLNHSDLNLNDFGKIKEHFDYLSIKEAFYKSFDKSKKDI